MSAAFTPGPWLTTGTTVYSLFFARGHERNKWDCIIYGDLYCPRDELQANAHLIAAAPRMYHELVHHLEMTRVYPGEASEDFKRIDAILKAARGEA